MSQGFGLTQAQIGERVGLSRESVSNYMRLLKLPGTVMQYLMNGVMGFSEARELLKLEENELIEQVAKQVVEKRLSFLQLMDMVERLTMKKYLREEPTRRAGRGGWIQMWGGAAGSAAGAGIKGENQRPQGQGQDRD